LPGSSSARLPCVERALVPAVERGACHVLTAAVAERLRPLRRYAVRVAFGRSHEGTSRRFSGNALGAPREKLRDGARSCDE
jgi:hypothetical protein